MNQTTTMTGTSIPRADDHTHCVPWCVLLINARNVTAVDFDDNDFPHYDLTLQTLTWDPTSNVYGVQERVKERDREKIYYGLIEQNIEYI